MLDGILRDEKSNYFYAETQNGPDHYINLLLWGGGGTVSKNSNILPWKAGGVLNHMQKI